MKSCDCKNFSDIFKLFEQVIESEDFGIGISSPFVVIEKGRYTVRIPQDVFRRFAEWYLEEQKLQSKD